MTELHIILMDHLFILWFYVVHHDLLASGSWKERKSHNYVPILHVLIHLPPFWMSPKYGNFTMMEALCHHFLYLIPRHHLFLYVIYHIRLLNHYIDYVDILHFTYIPGYHCFHYGCSGFPSRLCCFWPPSVKFSPFGLLHMFPPCTLSFHLSTVFWESTP